MGFPLAVLALMFSTVFGAHAVCPPPNGTRCDMHVHDLDVSGLLSASLMRCDGSLLVDCPDVLLSGRMMATRSVMGDLSVRSVEAGDATFKGVVHFEDGVETQGDVTVHGDLYVTGTVFGLQDREYDPSFLDGKLDEAFSESHGSYRVSGNRVELSFGGTFDASGISPSDLLDIRFGLPMPSASRGTACTGLISGIARRAVAQTKSNLLDIPTSGDQTSNFMAVNITEEGPIPLMGHVEGSHGSLRMDARMGVGFHLTLYSAGFLVTDSRVPPDPASTLFDLAASIDLEVTCRYRAASYVPKTGRIRT